MEAHRGNDDRRVAAPGVPDDRGSPTAAPPPGISHLLDDEIGPSTDNESAKPFQGGSKREGSGGQSDDVLDALEDAITEPGTDPDAPPATTKRDLCKAANPNESDDPTGGTP